MECQIIPVKARLLARRLAESHPQVLIIAPVHIPNVSDLLTRLLFVQGNASSDNDWTRGRSMTTIESDVTLTELARNWSPNFDDLTPGEIVARAEAIAPHLVPLQAETEERSRYSEEVHDLFRRAGFYRLATPRMFGGLEFDLETFFKVIIALSSGCPSTGWMYALGHSHVITVATYFEEEIQAEVISSPDFICPATVKPQGLATRRSDGDWELNGVFNFCSGVPYSSHFISHTFNADNPGRPMMFIAPRETFTVLDDWGNALGLNGTGSNSIKFEHAIIPQRFMLQGTWLMDYDVSNGTEGTRLHGNPLYGLSAYAFTITDTCGPAVGLAKNSMAAFEEAMKSKMTFIPPFIPRLEDPDFQRLYGDAFGKIIAAEEIVLSQARRLTELARTGGFNTESERQLVALTREAQDLVWDAAQTFFRYTGSTSLTRGSRSDRAWRDASMLRSHSGLLTFLEVSKRELAKAHLGIG
jgi:3-hydroxy-9,10-secoandrosta-1,3,5(10)-triene-9,17-dione monooxygenase